MWQGIFSPPRRSNWIHVIQKCFSNYVYMKVMDKNLKEIGMIYFVSELAILLSL